MKQYTSIKLCLYVQPNPMAAIELIAEEPIRFVNKRIAHCDGGKDSSNSCTFER